jgi:ABC-type enterochelin transport system permease subunit
MLPPDVVKEWAKVHKQAPEILLQEIANDARHLRRMAWARLISAVTLFGGSMALSAFFVASDAAVGGAISAGGGTISVVTILLTGKPPALRRR